MDLLRVALLALVVALVVRYAAACTTRRYMFAPSPGVEPSDFRVPTADGEALAVNVDRVARAAGAERVSLFFHGNSGELGHYRDFIARDMQHGYTVVSFDYRGYGHSSGTPSEDGLLKDAEAVLDWTLRHFRVPASQLLLHGFSLGCGVALAVAAHRSEVRFAGLLLEAPFASIQSAATHMMPYIRIMRPLLTRFFDNEAAIQKCNPGMPLAIAYTRYDETCPPADARRLFSASPAFYRFIEDSEAPRHGLPHASGAYAWLLDVRQQPCACSCAEH